MIISFIELNGNIFTTFSIPDNMALNRANFSTLLEQHDGILLDPYGRGPFYISEKSKVLLSYRRPFHMTNINANTFKEHSKTVELVYCIEKHKTDTVEIQEHLQIFKKPNTT